MNDLSAIEAAFALLAKGALADAEIAYRRILADHPQHAEAQHYLGVLRYRQGETQDGIARIMRALEADGGTAHRYNDLGNILVQTGDLANAAGAFRLAVERDGADANVWNNLGSVLYRQKDYAGAEGAYRNALHCDADFAPALNNLATLLTETGREEESSLFSCLAYILPPLTGKPPKMLGIAYYRLGRIADAAECYRAWLHAEPENAVARHHLAACTGQDVPARASNAFVMAVFDDMAASFNEKLVGKLAYRGPQIIAALLDGHIAANGKLDVLDGGCGTGLCAPILTPLAGHLAGVDLSPAMLAKARESKLYDELVEAELTDYLRERNAAFDLIVMADTLVYFGDLAVLFALVRRALKPCGTFVFTVEASVEPALQQTDYLLGPSGRYSHSRHYLARQLDAAGFVLLRADDVALRSEFSIPTQGIGMLARVLPG